MPFKTDLIETQTISSACPACGKMVDVAMGTTAPKKDDISLCINCGGIAKFAEDLSLIPLNEKEEKDINSTELVFGGNLTTLLEMRQHLRNVWEKNKKLEN
jgi:hypothetical protein